MATTWSYEDLRANGVSLKNFGYGISIVGGLSGIPPKEGKNYNVAYGRGTQYRAKQYTELQRTLVMWIDARNPDTGIYPASQMDRIAQRNNNAIELFRLFADNQTPVTLSRDILVLSGGTRVLETWTAQCEVTEAIYPDWGDRSNEETLFSMGVKFMDPFWYGSQISGSVNAGGTAVINNVGDVAAIDLDITITGGAGGLVNPQLTNTSNNVYMRLGTTIASGASVLVETRYPRVIRSTDNANLIGAVVNSGSRSFMRLERGNNTLSLSTDSGTGSASLVFRPLHV